jgi:hypothetical protein
MVGRGESDYFRVADHPPCSIVCGHTGDFVITRVAGVLHEYPVLNLPFTTTGFQVTS